MPIQTYKKIEIPAQEFDKLWVCSVTISAPIPGQEASACVALLPYNDTGETCPSRVEILDIDNLISKSLDQSSNIAKAMYFLLAAIDDEYVEKNKAQEKI